MRKRVKLATAVALNAAPKAIEATPFNDRIWLDRIV